VVANEALDLAEPVLPFPRPDRVDPGHPRTQRGDRRGRIELGQVRHREPAADRPGLIDDLSDVDTYRRGIDVVVAEQTALDEGARTELRFEGVGDGTGIEPQPGHTDGGQRPPPVAFDEQHGGPRGVQDRGVREGPGGRG
jgi:hypothetical protein